MTQDRVFLSIHSSTESMWLDIPNFALCTFDKGFINKTKVQNTGRNQFFILTYKLLRSIFCTFDKSCKSAIQVILSKLIYIVSKTFLIKVSKLRKPVSRPYSLKQRKWKIDINIIDVIGTWSRNPAQQQYLLYDGPKLHLKPKLCLCEIMPSYEWKHIQAYLAAQLLCQSKSIFHYLLIMFYWLTVHFANNLMDSQNGKTRTPNPTAQNTQTKKTILEMDIFLISVHSLPEVEALE